MLNKYTIIGLIVGCVISGLGVASMIDSFTNPIEIRQTNDTFGIGDSDKIRSVSYTHLTLPTILLV